MMLLKASWFQESTALLHRYSECGPSYRQGLVQQEDSLARELLEFRKSSSTTVEMHFVPSSFLFLVVRPGATSSVLAPSSKARSP